MKTIVVLQARTNSSRLPAKVLLPVGGYPLVVLSYLRACNTGLDGIVVTSEEESDDYLCDVLSHYKVPYFRGSLNNTLGRFCSALKNYDEQTIVVRLTADNVCPDGSLIEEVVAEFNNLSCDYMYCNGIASGLPYGMSLEVTLLKHLRDADAKTKDDFDREHVTPYIKRQYAPVLFDKYKSKNKGYLNCTIDNLAEYLKVARVFDIESKPESVSWQSLTDKLASESPEIDQEVVKKIVLGGAQLGSNYGITNSVTMNRSNTMELLCAAASMGVSCIDTASVYGESEQLVGNFMRQGWYGRVEVITKLYFSDDELEKHNNALDLLTANKVYQSLLNLGGKSIDCLLLHRYEYMTVHNRQIWMALVDLKKQGLINRLGVSVQSPEELLSAIKDMHVEHIQMPYNVLDWRWSSVIEEIIKRKAHHKLRIHCRSVYLQGLLLSNDKKLWNRTHVANPSKVIDGLKSIANKNQLSVQEFLLGAVLSQDWIDGVVIGMTDINQLRQNLSVKVAARDLSKELRHNSLPRLSEETLNPSKWSNLT